MKKISGTTGLYALLGSPVAHSISPLMYNESFQFYGLDHIYLCFDINEDSLTDAVRGLQKCNIRGFNLTMPNKNLMVQLVDELSPAASLIGAVNTVDVRDGRMIGHNTDGVGYMQSLRDKGIHIEGRTMTLMGIGGAATAICAQAALDGVSRIHIFARKTSRFHKRTEILVDKINQTLDCQAILHDHEDTVALKNAVAESAILTNATSVGMAPKIEDSIIKDPSLFRPELIVSDVIYNPRKTRLMADAENAGCQTVNGMYMLLYQGAEAFKIWTAKEMPIDLIKDKYFR